MLARNYFLCFITLPLLLWGIMIEIAHATSIRAMSASKLLGEHRILVACNVDIFPSSLNWADFAERDLVVVESNLGRTNLLYENETNERTRATLDWSRRFQDTIACSDSKEFILIGKDTYVKKRWKETLPINDLFQTIDAMPMRQYEMRIRGGN